jgi:hypothetical protein
MILPHGNAHQSPVLWIGGTTVAEPQGRERPSHPGTLRNAQGKPRSALSPNPAFWDTRLDTHGIDPHWVWDDLLMEGAGYADVWAAAHAYAASYPVVVTPDSGVQGRLLSVGMQLSEAATDVVITATYVSALGALKTHRVLVSAEQIVREHRMGFLTEGGEGGPHSSALVFARYDSVECTFGWNLPDDETVVDGPDWTSGPDR